MGAYRAGSLKRLAGAGFAAAAMVAAALDQETP